MKHLLPETRELVELPAHERIQLIHTDQWIGYGSANRTLDILETLVSHPRRVRMPNLLIVGPTNNGKSMIVEKFRRRHPPTESPCGNHEVIPVVVMQMPAEPGVTRFYSTLLQAINIPCISYRTSAAIEQGAIRILGEVGARVLVIDEIHNLLAGPVSKQQEFLILLRFLGNELKIPIVAVGIKDAYLAIRSDPQLENRFEPAVLPVWKNDMDFARLLASFIGIFPLKKPSDILTNEARKAILERTEGTIGEISILLRRAAALAISSQHECIDLDLLSSVDYSGPNARRRLYESLGV